MKLASLYSGGKDSTYAVYLAERMGHTVTHLLTIIPSSEDSLFFHYPNAWITALQAEAMGKEHLAAESSTGREAELEALGKLLDTVVGKVDGVVVGALASRFQYEAFNKLCRERGLDVFAPLWGKNPLKLLREVIAEGFEIMITGVAAAGLGEELLGKRITPEVIQLIEGVSKRMGVHPGGEGGEFETLVIDAPLFRKRIEILSLEKVWKGDRGVLYIRKARLRER